MVLVSISFALDFSFKYIESIILINKYLNQPNAFTTCHTYVLNGLAQTQLAADYPVSTKDHSNKSLKHAQNACKNDCQPKVANFDFKRHLPDQNLAFKAHVQVHLQIRAYR